MTSIAFKRKYEISFYPADETAPSLLLAQATGQTLATDRDYDRGFALDFLVTSNTPFYNSASKNTASITLYNLKAETARALQQPGVFNLAFGYAGTDWVEDIFSGRMVNATYGKQGNDRFLTLDLASGNLAQKNQIFQKSYGAGATTLQIVSDIVQFICQDYFTSSAGAQSISIAQIKPEHVQVYTNPVAFKGDAVDILAQLLPAYHVLMANKTVEVIPKKTDRFNVEYAYGKVFDLSPEYGEIYSSMTGKASIYDFSIAETGIDAKTILLPNLQVGSIVRLSPRQTESYFDQYATNNPAALDRTLYYQVDSIVHTGNTFNGEYSTSFRASFINQLAPFTIDDTLNLA